MSCPKSGSRTTNFTISYVEHGRTNATNLHCDGTKNSKKNYLSFEINGARTIPRFLTGLMSIALECNTIHNYPF